MMQRRTFSSRQRERNDERRSWRAGIALLGLSVVGVALVVLATTPSVTAQDGATPPAASVSTQEVEVLRKLLGLPAPPPPAPEPVPIVEPLPEPAPAVVEPPVVAEEPPATPPKPSTDKARPPVTRPPARKPSKPVVKSVPKPATPSKPVVKGKPLPPEPQPSIVDNAVQEPLDAAVGQGPGTPSSAAMLGDVPAPGTVVSAANMDRWKHLLGPSIQWSLSRGATMDVVAYQPTPLEPFRMDATQRYHAQVELAPDKRSLRNYIAGIPFPFVTEDDPDVAVKLMFNFENRISIDDLDVRNFSCDTGSLEINSGFTTQRHYVNEHFRRLYYVSRFHHEPKPTWPNKAGMRHREMLYPLLEPFDLKGAGFTYIRYQDPSRQDDSWLYFPQQKRVRRLGTAQRSEGVFGQDIDLDSYAGYSGNPAWMQWQFLGKKTILASMHSSKHVPGQFQKAPANFFPDDVWEPREVYVILGVSELGGYNLGRRVIYLDRESLIIPYTELYDLQGGLWKAFIQSWHMGKKPRPEAKRAVYDYDNFYIRTLSLIDMQLDHATRCQLPGNDMPNEEGWYYNFGPEEGTTPDQFEVANFIETGR